MISDKQLASSLNRMKGMKYFPTDPAVVTEMGHILDNGCETDSEAETVTLALMRNKEWPGTSELLALIQSEVVAARPRNDDERCPNCAPQGAPGWREVFIYTDRKTGKEVSREFPDENTFSLGRRNELEAAVKRSANHDGYFAVARCSCPAGRRGAEYDAHNQRRRRYFNPKTITG